MSLQHLTCGPLRPSVSADPKKRTLQAAPCCRSSAAEVATSTESESVSETSSTSDEKNIFKVKVSAMFFRDTILSSRYNVSTVRFYNYCSTGGK